MTDLTRTQTAPTMTVADRKANVRLLVPLWPEPGTPVPLRGPLTVGRAGGGADLEIPDGRMSRRHFRLTAARTAQVTRLEDLGSKNGTLVTGQVATEAYLDDGAVIRAGDALFAIVDRPPPPGVVVDLVAGRSVARQWAEQLADRVATTRLSVLITGPTGAGKELLAQRLHARSGRAGAFVPVNCATLPRELVASELFGHVRGAFSGAREARDGLFRSAHGGTLFLDEVGELPIEQQAALLRVLQDGKVRPVGSDREITVDVRILAATLQNLTAAEADGAFRGDLFGRLAGFELPLPGLAYRRGDILPLFRHFVGPDLPIEADAAEALVCYGWPRNVRELKNVAERVTLFAGHAGRVGLGMLPTAIQKARRSHTPIPEEPDDLEATLRHHRGNVAKVARSLGLTRQQVYRRLTALGLDPKAYR